MEMKIVAYVKLVKFFGEPMNIKTPFSNINFWNKTKFFIQNNIGKQRKTFSLH